MAPLNLLLLEDSLSDAKLLEHELRRAGRELVLLRVESGEAMREALAARSWDAIVSDWSMPSFTAPDALAILKELALDLPFIIVSGTVGEEAAVQAMRAGAHDYVLKGKLGRLDAALDRELREAALRRESREAHARIARQEAMLRVSEARYRQILETTREAVWVTDAAGQLTYVNARMAALFGQTTERLLGRSLFDLVGDDVRAHVEAGATEDNTAHGQFDTTLRRPDGSEAHCLVETTSLRGEGGAYTGTLGMMMDVTERHRAEAELRASERRFSLLFESGIVGIAFSDLGGRIDEANDTYLKLLGYSREELTSGEIVWQRTLAVETVPTDQRIWTDLQTRGVSDPFERDLRRKDGTVFPSLCGVALLEGTKLVVFVADLSAQKRAEAALQRSEDQLRQAQKMEAMGRLAGGVAHDFNNLLSVILGQAELVLEDPALPASIVPDLEEIKQAGLRASALTKQLLMFSRQQVVAPTVIDLNAVLGELDRMLRRIVGEDVAVQTSLADDIGQIRADRGQLEQVLMNLVVNARDAMPRGGVLLIETGSVEIADGDGEGVVAAPGRYTTLAIRDTGTGIEPAVLARIFDPFFTTKEKGKGTGLGLSTVFGIVTNSGGTIRVHSEVGVGTAFTVYLPRVDARVDVARPAHNPVSLEGHETILLVEDEAQVRTVACTILRRAGYDVLVAETPDEALRVVREHTRPIHVLLTDVVMPVMSGPDLAAEVVRQRPQIAVICMSGYMDDTVSQHGVHEQGFAFIQKPITRDPLLRMVRTVIDGGR